jgi:enoyl-CoA hydratase/carnithine racemase
VTDRVRVTVEAGVADVRMVRAEKMNAIDPAMFLALAAAGEELKARADVRAVVLSGEGRAFCAGLDMASMQQLASSADDTGDTVLDDATTRSAAGANLAQQACYVWRELPVPVIAAVHGVAFGGGFQLALGADLRIVAPDARLAVLEIKWGLIPDMSGMVLLRDLVRDDVARELTWTGRILSGEEAVGLGIATRVAADPHAAALELAREIAAKSPSAIRAGKRLLTLSRSEASAHDIFLAESLEQRALIGTPNQTEAVMANFEKREPVFRDQPL